MTLPLQQRIATALRDQIESGQLKPGDEIPTIAAVAQQWGVTTVTAQRALATLKEEGLITGGRGKPATVREPAVRQRIELNSRWADEQKALVLRPREERAVRGAIEMISGIPIDQVISTHDYDTVAADSGLAAEFEIPVGTPLQRRTYQMRDPRTKHRLSFSVSYIPLDLIRSNPDLLDSANEPWPGGHQHQLYTVGIEIDRFIRTVIAVPSTADDRQQWGIDAGVPLLRVRSRSVDTNNRVVELSDATYPGDRTEIELTEQLTRWPLEYRPGSDMPKGDS